MAYKKCLLHILLSVTLLVTHCNCCLKHNVDFCGKGWSSIGEQHIDHAIPRVSVSATISTHTATYTVDSKFVSLTLGVGLVRRRWKHFDFNSVKLQNLASALSPAIIRLGGTDADFMIFDGSIQHKRDDQEMTNPDYLDDGYHKKDHRTNFTMSGLDWDNINTFASNAGWDVLFDFNVLLRNGTDWDPTNAIGLLKYNALRGYPIAGWELGNEPNHIENHSNISLTASQLGADFILLRSLLDKYGYQDTFLVGPDVTRPRAENEDDTYGHASIEYLTKFLKHCGNSTMATTWHSYSVDGRVASADNFTDPVLMDVFKAQVLEIQSLIQKYRPFLNKSWIGETAGAYGGGAHNLSNAYAGGFLWLDKLGVSAANGVDIVFRQSFYGGAYGLIEAGETLHPSPVYWLSYIYKQLVGQTVLTVDLSINKDSLRAGTNGEDVPTYIRAYAHCTNKTSRLKSKYPSGSVTLFMLNLHKSAAVKFFLGGGLQSAMVDQYLLTPHGSNNITATNVNLNGIKLQLTSEETIPAIKGEPLPPGKHITLPSLTYGFFVINANATACL